jgi:hypothetical protein
MAEQLPVLVETSLQIAWDFLDGTGGIADPQETAEFLLANITTRVRQGERRILALSALFKREPCNAAAQLDQTD